MTDNKPEGAPQTGAGNVKQSIWAPIKKIVDTTTGLWKLGALLLGVLIFIGGFIPTLRQQVEGWISPHYWYKVGNLSDPSASPRFSGFQPQQYRSPAWDTRLHIEEFYGLLDEVIIIDGKDGDARNGPGSWAGHVERTKADTCLRVVNMSFTPFNPATARPIGNSISRAELGTDNEAAHAQLLLLLPDEVRSASRPPCVNPEDAKVSKEKDGVSLPVCPRIAVWVKAHKVIC